MDAIITMTTLNKELIGNRIKEARERAGLKQATLGKLLGLSQAGVTKLEGGEALTLENIFRLSEVLDCSVSWILGIGTDELSPKEVEVLSLFRGLPDHQGAILSILRGLSAKYGIPDEKR